MAKTPVIYVNDIISAILRINKYTANLTQEQFNTDELRQDAVIRCLEIISEASRRIPENLKEKHKHIPWIKIARIGNILRHEYHSVSADVVWDVKDNHLPQLYRAAVAIKKEMGTSGREDEGRGR